MSGGATASIATPTHTCIVCVITALERDADADRSFRRGSLWAVGRALPDGASCSRGLRGLLPERRAERSNNHPLRREGPAVATDRGSHPGSTRSLYSSVAERDEDCCPSSRDLEQVCEFRPRGRGHQRAQDEAGSLVDQALGPGAAATVQRITLNIGTIAGVVRLWYGYLLFRCGFQAAGGIRARRHHAENRGRHRPLSGSQHHANQLRAQRANPFGDMSAFIASNVQELRGYEPSQSSAWARATLVCGASAGVPAYIYGPFPHGMGQADEYVDIEDFLHVVRVHALSALDYLTGYHRQLVRDPPGEQRSRIEGRVDEKATNAMLAGIASMRPRDEAAGHADSPDDRGP